MPAEPQDPQRKQTSSGQRLAPRYHEPLRTTLTRTGTIALVVGLVLSLSWGRPAALPAATLSALWPALGGHYVEVFFLNGLRPRLPASRYARIGVRLGVWFVGGAILFLGMKLTATALTVSRPAHWPTWWVGGVAFIGIELVAHLVLQLRGCPSFYNGRG